MKRIFLFIVIYVYSVLHIAAQTYTVEFSPDEFRFIGENTCLRVYPVDDFKYFYPDGEDCPALPLYTVSVLLEPDRIVSDYSFTELSQNVLYQNVTLGVAPTPVPTDQVPDYNESTKLYTGGSYPAEVLKYSDMGECRGNRIAYFTVSPFRYDSTARSLSLVTKIELNITTAVKENNMPYHVLDKETGRSLVNPEANGSISSRRVSAEAALTSNSLDYLIVTNAVLKPYFESLREWKNKKGVRTEIVTVEEIRGLYDSMTKELAIKSYIRDCYVNRNLTYVLLAGDQTVIPAVYCKSPRENVSPTIPADMFYSTFDKAFNWDGNGNGILGEENDNVDLEPEVYLSRISVGNTTDAKNIVKKIIDYETAPNLGYINKMLMAGCKLFKLTNSGSDSELKSEKMYAENIQPYWNGTRHRLYDTNTDFGGAGYDVTAQHLSEILNQGYHFVHMMTHGNINIWGMETTPHFFSSDASALQNYCCPSNIVTNACLVNYFDSETECLSEAFMNHPTGGAVSFFASSRQGWTIENTLNLVYSELVNAHVYNNLFKENICHFAELTTKSKLYFTNYTNDIYLWLQYSLNSMGDPEMPIYTDVPQTFNNVYVSSVGNALSVYTGVSGCTISVTDGDSYFQVLKNTNYATFYNLPESYCVVVTKHNYIPFQQSRGVACTYIQNETIKTTRTVSHNVKIGYDVTNEKTYGDVVIKNGGKLIVDDKDEVLIKNGFTVELGGELEIK